MNKKFIFAMVKCVELPCTIEIRKILKFERCIHSKRVNAVVFNCIRRAHNHAVLKTFDCVVEFKLYFFGE